MTTTSDSQPAERVAHDAEEREQRRSVIRGMIQHEDDLRSQRLGWLFALNGFLFAAAGVAWTTSNPRWLLIVLAATGVLTSLSCWVSLWAGTKGIRVLNTLAKSEKRGDDLPVVGLRTADLWEREMPKVMRWAINVVYPWNLVPWVLALAWVAIAVCSPGHW